MNRTALIPIGIALVTLLGAAGGYWWWFQELLKVRTSAAELATQVAEVSMLREEGTRARTQEAELLAHEVSIRQHIVRPEGIVGFLDDIERAGVPYGSTVAVASVGDIEKDGRMLVSLTISGSFNGVMRTLVALEHGPYALVAKSATIDMRESGWGLSGSFYVVATPTP